MTEHDTSIGLTLEGSVTVLRLNRPERLNALTNGMADAMRAALASAVRSCARAVLLTGQGSAFCSGADLTGVSEKEAQGADRVLRTHYNPLIQAIATLPIPVVVAVNGVAAGAGASLALAGDIIIMARSAYLLLAFAKVGLVPDAGATWLVTQSAGRAKALEMALLGERLSAEEAEKAGLVTRVVDDGQLPEEAMQVARRLAAMPTVALGLIRAQVTAALSMTLTQSLEMEAEHQSRAARTSDFQEGVRAFIEKRTAMFQGV